MTENNGQSAGYRDTLGRFVNGNPGRKHGSKNRLREKVKGFVQTNIENLQSWFDELGPKDKIKVLGDLLPFCISRLQSVAQHTVDEDGNPQESTTIDYSKLSEKTLKEILEHTQTLEHENEN
jgi:hypothetical protein